MFVRPRQVGRNDIPLDIAKIVNVLRASKKVTRLRWIIALAASHRRLLWIHPFYDGNGRVTRLFSHAYLRHIGIGNSLWSVSRGLARKVQDYKSHAHACG